MYYKLCIGNVIMSYRHMEINAKINPRNIQFSVELLPVEGFKTMHRRHIKLNDR